MSNDCDFSYERVSEELLDYMQEIRREHPDVRFGLEETVHWFAVGDYPSSPGNNRGDLLEIIDTFLRVVNQGGERLDYFHAVAPYDWTQNFPGAQGWSKLKSLEGYVHEKGLRFGVVYSTVRGGETSDELFYEDVLLAKAKFEEVGGDPDDFILKSWGEHPKSWLPDDEPFTFTNLIKYFVELSADDITEKFEN